jgi:ATP sulfurylase
MFAPLEAKMMKNDLKKMIKKMKTLEENCNFPFFGKCLHHWEQK